MTTNHAAALRARLAEPGLLTVPGIYDGVSAHLARRAGFPAGYLSGGSVAAFGYGLPDIGLVTETETTERLRIVVEASGLPVIADADTGYGVPMHAVRTLRHFEDAGAAGIQIEDQTSPKRCGHLADKQVVDVEEFLPKLRAVLDARTADTVVVARTDAIAPLGLDEAIRRGRRYAAEGADVVFVEALESVDQIERAVAEIDAPVLFNVVPGGRSPGLTDSELERLGVKVAIHPAVASSAALQAQARALAAIGGDDVGDVTGVRGLFRTVGLDDWAAIDRKYV